MDAREPIFNVPSSVLAAIAALVLIHVARGFLAPEDEFWWLLSLAFVPARYSGHVPEIPGGEIAGITSFATHMLVHGDVTHLAMNCIWMLAFGSAVAKRVGGARFLAFSLLCGVAGAATHLALHFGELTPVIGASGAVSGQMAGAIRFLFSAPRGAMVSMREDPSSIPLASVGRTLRDPRIVVFLAVWIGLNVILGLGYIRIGDAAGGIAWEAHIGGFLCGLFVFGQFDRQETARAP